MDEEVKQITAQRRNRINKIKKIIIIAIIVLIIIPIVLCIILAVKVYSLEKRLDEIVYAQSQGKHIYMASSSDKLEASKNDNQTKPIESIEKDTIIDTENLGTKTDKVVEETTSETVTEETTTSKPENDLVDKDDENKPGYGKTVCLTFDDGPSANTDIVLDLLDKYNVKATFFVIGSTREEDIQRYKKIVERGHSIGLHTYSHKYEYIYSSVENFANDINKIHDVVYNATGVDTKLFRFPGGSANHTVENLDIRKYINYLNENGYTYFDWNVSSGDATSREQTVELLMGNISNDIYKFDTSVVLMHDSSYKKTTVEMLPKLLEKLIDEGFTLKPIDENTTKVQQIRDNK